MLFDRRHPPKFKEKLRVAMWPRRSWRRSIRYILTRLSRLRTSPHAIAIGASAGVLISFTPFLGFHFLLAGLLAFAARGSILASALGTFFGNPLTFPFIWVGSYQLGARFLGLDTTLDGGGLVEQLQKVMSNLANSSLANLWTTVETLWPIIIKPMTVGGIPMGLVAATISYYLIKKLVDTYQHRKDNVVSA